MGQKTYITINNYNKKGSLHIATKVFKDIAIDVLNKTEGVHIGEFEVKKGKVQTFDFNKNVVVHDKDGRVELDLKINVKKGVDVNDLCLNLQKEINDAILFAVEQLPVKIKIKVENII